MARLLMNMENKNKRKVILSTKWLHFILSGNVSVCITFHSNPPNNWWDISSKTTNVNFMMAREEKSGDQQGHWDLSPEDQDYQWKINSNQFHICWNISVWIKVVNWLTIWHWQSQKQPKENEITQQKNLPSLHKCIVFLT